jgi:hypothetical protein
MLLAVCATSVVGVCVPVMWIYIYIYRTKYRYDICLDYPYKQRFSAITNSTAKFAKTLFICWVTLLMRAQAC